MDTVAKIIILTIAGNGTPVVQPVASYYNDGAIPEQCSDTAKGDGSCQGLKAHNTMKVADSTGNGCESWYTAVILSPSTRMLEPYLTLTQYFDDYIRMPIEIAFIIFQSV